MVEKKRKAQSGGEGRTRKKAAIELPGGVIQVHAVPADDFVKPIIASTPGLTLPANVSFQGYSNGSEVLLQTSSHPTIDFTATEDSKADKAHLKHYVAVYDQTTGRLELTEARKVTARGQIRPGPKDEEDQNLADATAAANAGSNYSSRAALTETFGTKKSKKAVQSLAENRLLATDGDSGAQKPLSDALLASMPTEDSMPAAGVDLVQVNKPLPKANLTANHLNEAYPLDSLVFPPGDTLENLDVSDWQEKASSNQDIQTTSRFVAQRVEAYALASLREDNKDRTQNLRLLRYLLILIEFSRMVSARGGSSTGRKVMPTAMLLPKFSNPKPSQGLIEGIRRRFVPSDGTVRAFETQLLHTTICALTLHLPASRVLDKTVFHWSTEPSAIRDDLAVDDRTIRQYFRELGCRLAIPTDAEAQAFNIKKRSKKEAEASGDALTAKGRDIRIAKLVMPLQFPKRSAGRPNR